MVSAHRHHSHFLSSSLKKKTISQSKSLGGNAERVRAPSRSSAGTRAQACASRRRWSARPAPRHATCARRASSTSSTTSRRRSATPRSAPRTRRPRATSTGSTTRRIRRPRCVTVGRKYIHTYIYIDAIISFGVLLVRWKREQAERRPDVFGRSGDAQAAGTDRTLLQTEPATYMLLLRQRGVQSRQRLPIPVRPCPSSPALFFF